MNKRKLHSLELAGKRKLATLKNDNPTGQSERKKKKRQTEEEVGRQYHIVDRNGLCQLN